MPAADRSEPVSPALGDALRGLRRSRGLAQRDLLRPLHLGSHSAIVDFEAGRRIPPDAVIVAYEQFFGLPRGALRKLREQALAERAAAQERNRPRTLAAPADLPRQLPAAPEVFTGRTAELAQLDRLLRDRETSSPVVISAVSGMGGIGKTALALHWAHLARDNFTDGELYIDMQGYHPSGRPVTAQAAISQFLVALGVAADRIPVTLGEQTGLYRTLMADRQMLVLLDNVRDADQVRPLLPASPRCRVLITSRSRLPGLAVREGAQRIALNTLHLREAVRLLRLTIGGEAAREPGATAALAHLCGLHPLALRIAAERVVLSGGVGEAVTALSQSPDRLAELAVPEDDEAAIHKVFTWSYEGLGDAERRLFRLLGLHDGADIALAPLSALAGLDEARCASRLAALVDAHLIEVRAGEAPASEPSPCARYGMHDLLRLFAAERLIDGEPPSARREAIFRMAAWYLGSACAARTALDVNLPALPAVEADLPVPPMVFGTEAAALDWCDGERANLTAVTLSAAAHGLHEIGWKLPTALFPFYDRRRRFDDWVTTHLAAIEAAHAAADPESEGKVRCNLGSAYRPMRRYDEAVVQYEHALELFRAAGWRLGEGKALGNLASTYHESGRLDEGVTVGRAAIEVFRELGDAYGVALCLSNLGGVYTTRGEYDDAMETLSHALEAFTKLGDRRGMARVHGNMGLALIRTGRAKEAVTVLLEATRTFEAIADAHEQATSLADLAQAYLMLGQTDQARASATRSAEIFTALREDWLVAALKQRLPGLIG